MKRILTLASCLALLFAIVLVVQAQAQGHRFNRAIADPDEISRRGDFLAKALALTDAQKTAVSKLREELAVKAQPLAEQHRQQMDEIDKLLEGVNPDATEIGEQMIAAHATRQQLKALHDELETKLSALLTAEQLEKFKSFQETRREHGPFIRRSLAPEL